jgi:hypothetical protein
MKTLPIRQNLRKLTNDAKRLQEDMASLECRVWTAIRRLEQLTIELETELPSNVYEIVPEPPKDYPERSLTSPTHGTKNDAG